MSTNPYDDQNAHQLLMKRLTEAAELVATAASQITQVLDSVEKHNKSEKAHPSIRQSVEQLKENIGTVNVGDLSTNLKNLSEQFNTLSESLQNEYLDTTKEYVESDMSSLGRVGQNLKVISGKNNANQISSQDPVIVVKVVATGPDYYHARQNPSLDSESYNTWNGFTQHTDGQNLLEHVTFRDRWAYDIDAGAVRSNTAGQLFTGFVSKKGFGNYYLLTKISAVAMAEQGALAIVLAYAVDAGGVFHTISAIRAKNKSNSKYLWSMVYDFNTPDELVLASGEDTVSLADGIYNGDYFLVAARRSGNKLSVATSQISGTAIDERTVLTYTLPDTKPEDMLSNLYSNLSLLVGANAQVGFGAYGVNGNFEVLEQQYILPDNRIYDALHDKILKYNEATTTWETVGKMSDHVPNLSNLFNTSTGKMYYYINGVAILVNKAINDELDFDLDHMETEGVLTFRQPVELVPPSISKMVYDYLLDSTGSDTIEGDDEEDENEGDPYAQSCGVLHNMPIIAQGVSATEAYTDNNVDEEEVIDINEQSMIDAGAVTFKTPLKLDVEGGLTEIKRLQDFAENEPSVDPEEPEEPETEPTSGEESGESGETTEDTP